MNLKSEIEWHSADDVPLGYYPALLVFLYDGLMSDECFGTYNRDCKRYELITGKPFSLPVVMWAYLPDKFELLKFFCNEVVTNESKT